MKDVIKAKQANIKWAEVSFDNPHNAVWCRQSSKWPSRCYCGCADGAEGETSGV